MSTGKEIWDAFLTSGASDDNLIALGRDLVLGSAKPAPLASAAVVLIAKKLGIQPDFAYAAFNIGPTRPLLEGLAAEYEKRLGWERLSPGTRGYLQRIAERVTVIRNAMAQKKSA